MLVCTSQVGEAPELSPLYWLVPSFACWTFSCEVCIKSSHNGSKGSVLWGRTFQFYFREIESLTAKKEDTLSKWLSQKFVDTKNLFYTEFRVRREWLNVKCLTVEGKLSKGKLFVVWRLSCVISRDKETSFWHPGRRHPPQVPDNHDVRRPANKKLYIGP